MTPQEEAFLDSTMVLAFQHSKLLVSSSEGDGNVHMIDAQIVSKKTVDYGEKYLGKEMRRNIRYRSQRNRYHRVYDYSILFDFGCGNLCGDQSGFWDRRRVTKIASSDKFATTYGRKVCNILRASTFKVFRTFSDCSIRFV